MCKFLLSICLSVILLSSCNKANEHSWPVLDIKYALNDGKDVDLSKYASGIKYIPLESSQESLLSGYPSMCYDKGRLYFWDYSLNGCNDIAVFDTCGKFIKRIGKLGRGPGEYESLWRVTLEDDKDATNICIAGLQNAVIYNSCGDAVGGFSFNCIKEKTGNGFIMNGGFLNYIGDGKYCLLATSASKGNTSKQEMLFILDSAGNILSERAIGEEIVKKKKFKGISLTSCLGSYIYIAEDKIFQHTPLRDTLFAIDKITGEKNIKALFTMDGNSFGTIDNPDYHIGIPLESERFILHDFGFATADFPALYKKNKVVPEKASAWLVYDKQDKTYTALKYDPSFTLEGFKNDIDGGAPFLPSLVKDGKMYQLVNAIDFIEMAEKSTSARMKEVAAQLTEESNPVVVEVTLK